MGKLHTFWNVFRRHKYGFVIGLFVLLMGVVDETVCGAAIVIRLSWLNCALKSGSTRRCTSMTRVIWRK